jgi:hypothetical protein
MNKQEARRISDEIRQILVKVWDPLGIKDEPQAQDEYDSYIGGVFHLLVKRGSAKEIEDYLSKVIEEQIEININPQKNSTHEAAKALRSIRLE